MAPYTQLYVHYVWATWDRLPLITPAIAGRLYAALAVKARELGCTPLAINGMPDHVHVLVQLSTTITIARLVGEMKGSSSHLVTHMVAPGEPFKWQGSYGAFTVSKRAIGAVWAYIDRQQQHHHDGTLQPEFETSTSPE